VIVVSGEVELLLPGSRSLKDKRQVLSSIKGRLRSRFDIAVAEVDGQDLWQRGRLGLVTVSGSSRHAKEVMDKALRFIEEDLRVQIIERFIEER